MALLNFWSQKSFLDQLGSDVSGLKTYVDALNQCAHFLHACWDGNSDKQFVFMAIKKQIDEVNKQRQNVNWVQHVARFVLERINELGNLDGCSQPHVAQVPSTGMMSSCSAQTKIKLNTGKLRAAAEYLKGYRSCLENSKNNVAKATNVLDVFILGIWTIGTKISIANNQVDALLIRHDRIVSALYKCADIYDAADNRLKQKSYAINSPGLLEATKPYAFLTPEMQKLIQKYAKDIYDKIKDWFTGKGVKDGKNITVGKTDATATGQGQPKRDLTAEELKVLYALQVNFINFRDGQDYIDGRSRWGDALLIAFSDLTKGIRGDAQTEVYLKNSLREMFARMVEGNPNGLSNPDMGEDYFREMISALDESELLKISKGKDILNVDYGGVDAIMDLLDIFEAMGEAGEHIRKGIFGEYGRQIELLESMRKGILASDSPDPVLLKALEELRKEYDRYFLAALGKVANEVKKKGVDFAVESIAYVGIVNSVLKMFYSATGLTDRTARIEELRTTHIYAEQLDQAFTNARMKLLSQDPRSYNPEDVAQYEQLFELTKAAKLQQYQMMYELTKGDERSYYADKIKELKAMQLYDNKGLRVTGDFPTYA